VKDEHTTARNQYLTSRLMAKMNNADHRHTEIIHLYMLTIKNLATVRNFEVMSEKKTGICNS
jgi:hypothetical protein